MAILFAGKVAGVSRVNEIKNGVQDTNRVDFHAEHGRSEDMSGLEAGDLDSVVPSLLVVVDGLDRVHARFELLRRVDGLRFALAGRNGQVVGQKTLHDVARGVRHEDASALLPIFTIVEEAALYA